VVQSISRRRSQSRARVVRVQSRPTPGKIYAGATITVAQRMNIRMVSTHASQGARSGRFAYNAAGATRSSRTIRWSGASATSYRDPAVAGQLRHFETVGVWMMGVDTTSVCLGRTIWDLGLAATNHRALRSRAPRILCDVLGLRMASATSTSPATGLFGGVPHGAPDGHAQAARGHRGAAPRRNTRIPAARPHSVRGKTTWRHAQALSRRASNSARASSAYRDRSSSSTIPTARRGADFPRAEILSLNSPRLNLT